MKLVLLTAMSGRARRLAEAVEETYLRSGPLVAATFLWRQLCRKVPLLWRQVVTARRAGRVIVEVQAQRAALAPSRPCLAVAVTGGVGDFIVIARFLRDFSAANGEFAFDIFSPVPERAGWAFAAVPGFNRAYHDILFEPSMPEYDVALRANQMVVVYRECVRWGALRDRPDLVRTIATLVRARAKVDLFVAHHPFMDNFLARTAVFFGLTRRDFLHHMAGLPYGGDLLAVPTAGGTVGRIGLQPGGYVTVHNGFDTGFVIAGKRATKCYPHFGAVIAILKAALPQFVFVQLGTRDTSRRLPECDVDLVGLTTLPEVADVLAQAAFHIDNEGGLVHLARCYGVRAGVVFGPTPSSYFAYPDNLSIEPPVCGNCWWLTRSWMDVCVKGYPEPRCMTEQDPGQVAGRLLAAMAASGLTATPSPEADAGSLSPPDPAEAAVGPAAVANEATAAGGLGRWNYRGHADQPFGAVTYAQFGEDLVLLNLFATLGIDRPNFIDIGAHHPVNCNNTALLYSRGSRGVNIDANPNLMSVYADLRPEDLTLNVGVGPVPGRLDYYMIDEWSGRNTFDRATAEAFVAAHPEFSVREVRQVEVVTLDEVVRRHCGGRWPDLLCLDAEGMDYAILETAGFADDDGPRAICVEVVSGDDRNDSSRLCTLIEGRGYRVFGKTAGNLIFLRQSECVPAGQAASGKNSGYHPAGVDGQSPP